MGNNPAPVSQLHEATADGYPDENARDNCVPASLAWVLEDLAGGTFDGDQLKDAVYGQGYTGTMSAARFVGYAAAHGVRLQQFNGSQQQLVAELHHQLDAGGDALVTIPSQWGTAPANPAGYSGSSHVCAMGYTLAGGLRGMNPWGGFWQDESDAWWEARLVYGQIWLASKAPVPAPIGGTPVLERHPDGSATDPSNGHHVGPGIAADIFAHNWQSADLLTSETYIGKESYAALSNGVVEHWTGSAVDQNAAVVVTALAAALDSATQHADQLQADVAQLQQRLASEAPADPEAQAAKTALAQLKTALAGL